MRQPVKTLSPEAGIALGPILFVLAILGILAAVLSAGSSSFSTAGTADRVTADTTTQANLIRAKINECNLMYGTNNNFDGYPSSGGESIPVANITCSGDPEGQQNIWTGNRMTSLPPPTSGFTSWHYLNTNKVGLGTPADGGRCIWIKPLGAANPGIVGGLTRAAKKFTTTPANDGAAEVNYNPESAGQRFVVWISAPPATGQEADDCNSNK